MGITVSVPHPRDAAIFDGLDVTVVPWAMEGPAPHRDFDAVFAPGYADPRMFANLASISPTFVQVASIGYDAVERFAPPGFTFANAAGVHETATAEATVAAILAVARDIPRIVRQQDAHLWTRRESEGLADKAVTIVGAGGVGKAIADRLQPFEVSIRRYARTRRHDSRGEVGTLEDLRDALPTSDIVVVVVPLTDSTRHLVDDRFLEAMHDGAMLVNVARGPVADTEALLRHADRLRIVVDVTDPEPLPAEHPLWNAASLIMPHIGGASAAYHPRRARLMRTQAERILQGLEPINIVLRT